MITRRRLTIRYALLATVSFAVPAFAQSTESPPVQVAQAQTADSGAQLEEITVTAEKVATNLQKTPISISVMSADDLANRHAQSLEDLGDGSIPSLRIAPFFARSSALTIGMRG